MDEFTKEILIKFQKLGKSKKQKIYDENCILDVLDKKLSVENTCLLYLQANELSRDIPKRVGSFGQWKFEMGYIIKGEKAYYIFKPDGINITPVFAEYQVKSELPDYEDTEETQLECEDCKVKNKTVKRKIAIDRVKNKVYVKNWCPNCFNEFKTVSGIP